MRPAPVVLLAVLVLAASCGKDEAPLRLHTPPWAFRPWISKDISDGADTEAFVEGFRTRDIPVGTLVLDSPWETHYNSFVPNPARYPAFAELVAGLRAREIRTVLWITPLVNQASFDLEPGGDSYEGASPNFQDGLDGGFFVDGGRTYEWWKGIGAAVDFFHPGALSWWHAQQDALLDLGVAGWKLDFGDSYVTGATVRTHAGEVPHQAWSEAYYRDFWEYGARRVGTGEFVTMSRPWDQSYRLPGRFHARREHCPVGWVGDNRRDWVGLADALDHMFRSAEAGYLVIGSDIGGYLDKDDRDLGAGTIPFDVENFLRWTAVGALTPFMQLHGRANVTPWTVPERVEETVETYRWWSWLHTELGPFFYSLAEEGVDSGRPILRPVGGAGDWAGDYRYQLGDALLVAPILDATGVRDVLLPAGSRWVDWWHPEREPLEGGRLLAAHDVGSSRRIPLFLRESAILPLDVTNDVTGLGSAASAGLLTVLTWPAEARSTFVLHELDATRIRIESRREGSVAVVNLDRAPRPVLLRIRSETEPTGVESGGALAKRAAAELATATSGWSWEATTRTAIVKLPASWWGVEARLLGAR